MTKKEAVRELKKLRRNILAVLKSTTSEMPKGSCVGVRIQNLTDTGILTARFASGLKFFLRSTKEIGALSFKDALLYRKEAQAFLLLLRATRAALIR